MTVYAARVNRFIDACRDSRVDCVGNHVPMPVGRTQSQLASSPRLVGRRLQHLGTSVERASVHRIDVVDVEIRDVAVIADVGCRYDVRTEAEHEPHGSRPAEDPATGRDVEALALEHGDVPRGRTVEIMDREHRMGPDERDQRRRQDSRGAGGASRSPTAASDSGSSSSP